MTPLKLIIALLLVSMCFLSSVIFVAFIEDNYDFKGEKTYGKAATILDFNQRTDIIEKNNNRYEVVFLIRTYYGHFLSDNLFNIERTLTSLQSLTFSNWNAIIINTDAKPLPQLPIQDHRISILNISLEIAKYDEWVAGYDLTDAVLERFRGSKFKWAIITNGDNVYDKSFLDHLVGSKDIDLIVTDYWSRYDRSGSVKTTRMSSRVCHKGKLQPGFVDLGGVIFSLPRFHAENLKFMNFGPINSQDGFMFTTMFMSNWRVKHVPICLFSHAPNPYSCSQLGGTWYESSSSRRELGNACWSKDMLQKEMRRNPLLRLYRSYSRISLVSLPSKEHEKCLVERAEDQKTFSDMYFLKLRERRKPYCLALQNSGYQLDWLKYSKLNPDLPKKSKKSLIGHFWNDGCVQMRPIQPFTKNYTYALM